MFPWEGKQMEEEIYALHAVGSATMRGEAGVTTQTTWGLTSVHGFITQEGELDRHRSMFTYMVRSGTPNPAWVALHLNVKQDLDAQFQQNLIDNRRAREAIMAQSRALAVQNEAFRRDIEGWSKISPQLFVGVQARIRPSGTAQRHHSHHPQG